MRCATARVVAGAVLVGCRAAPSPGVVGGDSLTVEIASPTIVVFHPAVEDDPTVEDEGMRTALDDLMAHLEMAHGALAGAGYQVTSRIGDSLWLRIGGRAELVVRHPDSASIGYLLAGPQREWRLIYGVRSAEELIEAAQGFLAGTRATDRPE